MSEAPGQDVRAVVEEFLRRASTLDLAHAAELLDEHCRYENVPFHRAHGRERILRDLGLLLRPIEAFEVEMIHISDDGEAVLTERIDSFRVRGQRIAVPLMGAFVVRDGKIVEWRDYFDWSLVGLRSIGGLLTLPFRALFGRRGDPPALP